MLKSIHIGNVKGVTTDITFAPFTAIVGSNFSGKTAVADAIRLSLLGYVPALGKQNAASYQLASGDPMLVDAVLENPTHRFMRTWAMKKGSVKRTDACTTEWPAEILDIGVWLGASKKERISMVAGASGASEELAALVEKEYGLPEVDTIEKLERTIAELTEEAKNIRTQIAVFAGSMQGTTEIDTDLAPVTVDPDERPKAHAALLAARDAQVAAVEHQRHIEQLEMEADEADAELEDVPSAPTEDIEAELDRLKAGSATAEADLARAKKDLALLDEEIRNLNAKLTTKRQERIELVGPLTESQVRIELADLAGVVEMPAETIKDAADAVSKVQSTIAGHRANAATLARRRDELQSKIDGMNALECCPTCRASADGWRDAVLNTYRADLNTIKDQLDSTGALIDELASDLRRKELALDDLNREAGNWKRKNLLHRVDYIVREMVEIQDKIDTKVGEHQDLRTKVAESEAPGMIPARIEVLKAALAKSRAAAKYREAAARRPAPTALNDAVSAVEAATTALEQAEVAYAAAVAHAESAAKQAERQRVISEARDRHDALTEQRDAKNLVISGLSEILRSQNDALWGSINRACQLFANVAVECKLGVRDGDIGAWVNGSFVPYEALSGSEQLLAAAAVQLGLCFKAPCRILLLDELSRMSNETKHELKSILRNLLDEKLVDQVIVCDWAKPYWQQAGDVTVVDLDA